MRYNTAPMTPQHTTHGTARAVLAYALHVFPDRRNLWHRAADLEKAHGTHECLDKLLARAVECCPQAEVLWPMWAKEKWLGGDVCAACKVLGSTFKGTRRVSRFGWERPKVSEEASRPRRRCRHGEELHASHRSLCV
ncbi:hypothetical protein F5148DRAFT_841227 [Russula earlei]|uniref:Uncharacterized protein n=1 Tax=Russula earlei TaxID=71964 RepID=A0ACC0TTB5_9AGAM|nr:hypothetical protein F5148DRAFT_841227 [Russula earlei]